MTTTVEKLARARLSERSEGTCEICRKACATNVQHRKNRSQGGTWALSNLLHICGSGTTGCHGYIHANPSKAYDNGWMVKRDVDPRELPALLFTHYGWMYVWLFEDGLTDLVHPDEQLADLFERNRFWKPSL